MPSGGEGKNISSFSSFVCVCVCGWCMCLMSLRSFLWRNVSSQMQRRTRTPTTICTKKIYGNKKVYAFFNIAFTPRSRWRMRRRRRRRLLFEQHHSICAPRQIMYLMRKQAHSVHITASHQSAETFNENNQNKSFLCRAFARVYTNKSRRSTCGENALANLNCCFYELAELNSVYTKIQQRIECVSLFFYLAPVNFAQQTIDDQKEFAGGAGEKEMKETMTTYI